MLVTPDGKLVGASDSLVTLLGWDLEQCAVDGLCAALPDDTQRVAVQQLLERVLRDGSVRATVQVSGRLGRVWVDVAARSLGEQIFISARDVTDDVLAAHQLEASERQWRIAFEHSPIGGALLDLQGGVLVANEALARMVGRSAAELARMDVTDIVDCEGGLPWAPWWELVSSGAPQDVTERTLRSTGDHDIWSRLTGALVTSDLGEDRIVVQFEDITGRREAELELANRALHDGLTGVPNRFLTHQWLASALEDQPDGRVGVLYCDVDRFKIVNDSLGHAAGDSLLAQVAERLGLALRPEDLLGRVGGDEFVVILERVSGPAQLADIATRMAASLDEPFDLGTQRHAVTLSLGGSLGSHPDTADEVLMRADMALLRAKRMGRSRYVAFDPAHDRIATRADLQLEDDLRDALAADQLRAFYQPVVLLRSLTVAGHEALVRWQHPRLGLLGPERFLDLAESSGLIRPLGRWMLRRACQENKEHGLGLAEPGWVAVNVSPSQLARAGFAHHVTEALSVSGLDPTRLHLEITETALMTASATLAHELEDLSELGVRIGLDDFGTGYSSLSLLQKFPVHSVKIDRSFIAPVVEDRNARAIVRAVLSMCQDMGLPTVAEGIENPAQLDLLRALGCSHGQGYMFGRPLPSPTQELESQV